MWVFLSVFVCFRSPCPVKMAQIIKFILLFLATLMITSCLTNGKENIDYFENRLAQVCRPLDKNLDLMFLLDGSGSTNGNTFETQKNMVKRVIEQVVISPNKTRVAVLQYSGYTRTEMDFRGALNNMEFLEKLKNIRHISGTTRTGKALRRARNSFSVSLGARMNDPAVAQVVVVVSDGHSLDNPVPPSIELREKGVILMAMGIGNYINMKELRQMTEDPSLSFNNRTMDEFVATFRKIAIGEKCDFAKGPNGAEIVCGADAIQVNVMMEKPFHGHLYASGHYKENGCTANAENSEDGRTMSLNIPLNKCGVREQFMFSPRGLLVESSVILKYHPDYNSAKDQSFQIRCFYPDMRYHGKEGQDSKLAPHFSAESLKLKGDPLIASFPVPKMEMPCAYRLRKKSEGCILEDSVVGETLVHDWECDKSIIGEDYGFRIHSCYLTDGADNEMLVVDENGCSSDKSLISEVSYENDLKASATGVSVKFADIPTVKFACSIRFCNKEKGECEQFVKCNETTVGGSGEEDDDDSPLSRRRRRKRQVQSAPMLPNLAHMPPHMVQRLFMRKKQADDQKKKDGRIGAGIPTTTTATASSTTTEPSNGLITDSFGRPVVQTLAPGPTGRQGRPSVRGFRPIISESSPLRTAGSEEEKSSTEAPKRSTTEKQRRRTFNVTPRKVTLSSERRRRTRARRTTTTTTTTTTTKSTTPSTTPAQTTPETTKKTAAKVPEDVEEVVVEIVKNKEVEGSNNNEDVKESGNGDEKEEGHVVAFEDAEVEEEEEEEVVKDEMEEIKEENGKQKEKAATAVDVKNKAALPGQEIAQQESASDTEKKAADVSLEEAVEVAVDESKPEEKLRISNGGPSVSNTTTTLKPMIAGSMDMKLPGADKTAVPDNMKSAEAVTEEPEVPSASSTSSQSETSVSASTESAVPTSTEEDIPVLSKKTAGVDQFVQEATVEVQSPQDDAAEELEAAIANAEAEILDDLTEADILSAVETELAEDLSLLQEVDKAAFVNDPQLQSVLDDIKKEESLTKDEGQKRLAVEKKPMEMELMGLAVDIVAGLEFPEFQLDSQSIIVLDKVQTQRQSSNNASPLNWCPRPARSFY